MSCNEQQTRSLLRTGNRWPLLTSELRTSWRRTEKLLDEKYPSSLEQHWLPYDQSGETNANGTTIIGAYIAYAEEEDTTTGYCELLVSQRRWPHHEIRPASD